MTRAIFLQTRVLPYRYAPSASKNLYIRQTDRHSVWTLLVARVNISQLSTVRYPTVATGRSTYLQVPVQGNTSTYTWYQYQVRYQVPYVPVG
jgi:hypothetical protein